MKNRAVGVGYCSGRSELGRNGRHTGLKAPSTPAQDRVPGELPLEYARPATAPFTQNTLVTAGTTTATVTPKTTTARSHCPRTAVARSS